MSDRLSEPYRITVLSVAGTDSGSLLRGLRQESFHPPLRLVEQPDAADPPPDGRLVVLSGDASVDSVDAPAEPADRDGSPPPPAVAVLIRRPGNGDGTTADDGATDGDRTAGDNRATAGNGNGDVGAGYPPESPIGRQVQAVIAVTEPDGNGEPGPSSGGVALAGAELRRLRAALLWHIVRPSEARRVRDVLAVLEELAWSPKESGPDLDKLRYQLERFRSGAHELVELDLAEALRAGDVRLTAADREAAERLLGAHGSDPAARLGLTEDADEEAVRRAAGERLAYWQRLASHPVSTSGVRDAAEVLVHTCEELLTGRTG